MYAKVFAQIFDSSIAENHKTRHVFEDLLKLADSGGDVDMTAEAIARRTNVPLGEVEAAITELEKEDKKSRSLEFEGRRIIRLDDHRTWGWHIVNYQHYRNLIDEDSRRSFFRDAKRKQRKRQAEKSLGKVSKNAGQPLPGEEAYVRGVENGTIDHETGEAVRGADARFSGAGGRMPGVEAAGGVSGVAGGKVAEGSGGGVQPVLEQEGATQEVGGVRLAGIPVDDGIGTVLRFSGNGKVVK